MKRLAICLPVIAILFFVVSLSQASIYYTPVSTPWAPVTGNAAEVNLVDSNPAHDSIMNHLYGVGNYLRIDDSSDQIWWNPDGHAAAAARYAGDSHTLAWDENLGAPPARADIFTISGSSGYLGGSPSAYFLSTNVPKGSLFTFELEDGIGSGVWYSSDQSKNPNKMDHMVTFLITGGASKGNYVIAWEDRSPGDTDYQDLVVEVTGVSPIPEPATIIVWSLLGASWATLAVVRRRRSIAGSRKPWSPEARTAIYSLIERK